MFNSTPRFTRVVAAAVLATGFISSAHARPTDLDWKPGLGAVVTQTAPTPQRNLGAPFYGPRQTIPTLLSEVTPPQPALTNEAVRWVGPRSTVPVQR